MGVVVTEASRLRGGPSEVGLGLVRGGQKTIHTPNIFILLIKTASGWVMLLPAGQTTD